MISTILLLPHAETRERLLAPGVPVWIAEDDPEFGWTVGRDVPQSDGIGEGSEHLDCVPVAWASIGVGHADPTMLHLVLARSGAVVPEGVMRAWFEADDVLYDEENGLSDSLYGSLDDLIAAVSSWRRNGVSLGALLLLDSEGNKVTP